MKWLSIPGNSRYEIYELWNSKEKLLTMGHDPDKGTLRITANNEKRFFSIGKKGFLRSRMVLRNEYGVTMGELTFENAQANQRRMEIHDEEFTSLAQNSLAPKVAIYRNNEMLTVCELPDASKYHDLLTLMLCWHISTSIKKQVGSYPLEEYA
jgi:hypothetical protein